MRNKAIKEDRKETSSFVLTLKLDTEIYAEHILNKRFIIGGQIYNACLNKLYKGYNTMIRTKEYKSLTSLIEDHLKQYPKVKDDKVKLKEWAFKQRKLNKEMFDLRAKFSLNEYSLHEYVKPMQHHFKKNIDSFTAQKIATRCWSAFEKLLSGETEQVHFKRFNTLDSLEGKWNKSGIRFINNNLVWNGLNIPVIIKKNDNYTERALNNRVKYCRIKRQDVNGKVKYYVQLTLEGVPPIKVNSETGELKHNIDIGRVGLDIGTQTIAICSSKEVKLLELAPEVVNMDKEIKRLQRYMDRSRRATNPQNFNEDGTIKKGTKLNWVYSKKYLKAQKKKKELYRKQTEIRKQSHNKLANYILSLGNEVYVEKMNFKALQKRSKKTTKSEKTGKFNRKKRFGKSLANKAPSMILTIIDNKLKWTGSSLKEINTAKVKASQYNHLSQKYNKKKLSQRWNSFNYNGNEIKVQRDLYSSFLIMNVNEDLSTINNELCNKTFEEFYKLHEVEIDRLKDNNKNNISSMGVA